MNNDTGAAGSMGVCGSSSEAGPWCVPALDVDQWLAAAGRGAKLIYFVGNLMLARDPETEGISADDRASIELVSATLHEARLDGQVFLLQHRVTDRCFLYVAIRTGKPARQQMPTLTAAAA